MSTPVLLVDAVTGCTAGSAKKDTRHPAEETSESMRTHIVTVNSSRGSSTGCSVVPADTCPDPSRYTGVPRDATTASAGGATVTAALLSQLLWMRCERQWKQKMTAMEIHCC